MNFRALLDSVVQSVLYVVTQLRRLQYNRLKALPLSRSRLGRKVIDAYLWPFDFAQVLRVYRKRVGRYPKLFRPETLNDYLQRNKLIGRSERHMILADKVAVRDFVHKSIGAQYLKKLYWTGQDLSLVDKSELPRSFIIKAAHLQGANIIVRDAENFDWENAYQQGAEWLQRDLSFRFVEWQYRWMPPRILIEELLDSGECDCPIDYKYWCFHGEIAMIQVDVIVGGYHEQGLYSKAWERLPVQRNGKTAAKENWPPPEGVEEMNELAEKLSKGEPFVRVDFFHVGRPIFGEMTFHPCAGYRGFHPYEWEKELGRLVTKRKLPVGNVKMISEG